MLETETGKNKNVEKSISIRYGFLKTPTLTPDPCPDGVGSGAGVQNLLSVGAGRCRGAKKFRKSGRGGGGE